MVLSRVFRGIFAIIRVWQDPVAIRPREYCHHLAEALRRSRNHDCLVSEIH
jgi:hypothetical protein